MARPHRAVRMIHISSKVEASYNNAPMTWHHARLSILLHHFIASHRWQLRSRSDPRDSPMDRGEALSHVEIRNTHHRALHDHRSVATSDHNTPRHVPTGFLSRR